jgi:hypothetical protein
MRRRCAAHAVWTEAHPDVAAGALAFHNAKVPATPER